ncbi:hypothetical protein SAMD00019534_057490 [Acytostelium subglobosum LB1]|uniref:hypothetical protein n=1 Tax=Acytostelium subglobosum LB1 TaxID=1410327 RepID=UPI000645103F|nr:hypothetical protein SAMD00019534_057490 [Acytostelium subglobosum LB1]GAM22574.1 hypothetical protein SAMD00019534_057490 [Acytostelium subglobosum LB1]|eukprot:XP_012754694.1 hypothetical protein SAMD00019534_057490 [Acytostelium subglobosum LB1]
MVSLCLQKRLAASILKCGKGRVWIDPNEISEISMANSRDNVRSLIKNGFIIQDTVTVSVPVRLVCHPRFSGSAESESSEGCSRSTVRPRKIDRHAYRELYLKAKGNIFKNKRTLIEYIVRSKTEKLREKQINDQAQARRLKNRNLKERRTTKALAKHVY